MWCGYTGAMSLISATSLADLLAGPDAATVTVLDVRWTLARPDGRDAFAAGPHETKARAAARRYCRY